MPEAAFFAAKNKIIFFNKYLFLSPYKLLDGHVRGKGTKSGNYESYLPKIKLLYPFRLPDIKPGAGTYNTN